MKANGAVQQVGGRDLWVFDGGAREQIQPGDTVVVPINVQYKDTLSSWNQITNIIYQSVVSVAAVMRL